TEFSFGEEVQDLTRRLEECERQLYTAITAHNQKCHQHDSVVYDIGIGERHGAEFFQCVVKLGEQIDLIHNRLKNNVLVDKHSKLTSLKDSFNTAFITNLCHSIYQSICEGKRALDDLNKELEHHRFGADRERFYFGYQ